MVSMLNTVSSSRASTSSTCGSGTGKRGSFPVGSGRGSTKEGEEDLGLGSSPIGIVNNTGKFSKGGAKGGAAKKELQHTYREKMWKTRKQKNMKKWVY